MSLTTTTHQDHPIPAAPSAAGDAGDVCSARDLDVKRCILSHQDMPRARMVRFVVGPDSVVVPDIAGKLPGRGMWVCADAASLDDAVRKKAFVKAARGARCIVPDDLVAMTRALLGRRCLDLLGLARGAGVLVIGQPQIEESARQGRVACILMACDAGADIRKKMTRLPVLFCRFSKTEWAQAVGRDMCAALGLRPHALTDLLCQELGRLDAVSGGAIETVFSV